MSKLHSWLSQRMLLTVTISRALAPCQQFTYVTSCPHDPSEDRCCDTQLYDLCSCNRSKI